MKKLKSGISPRRAAKYVILAAIVTVVALIGWVVYLMLLIKPARDVSTKFLDNLKAKNPEAALALTTENFQNSQAKDDIEQAVSSPLAAKILEQKYNLHYKKITKKSPLTVDFIYKFKHAGNEYEVSMTVVKQSDEFKIDKASVDSAALKQKFFGQ